jgi:16S rRNA (adenine1518-N6/adenine1519-N6)-dimethyltransferase
MSHQPRKRFGQHFLCDQSIIHQIVYALSPQVSDHLVEIGPGQGAITIPVLKMVKQLDVIELDKDLVPELKARSHDNPFLHIHLADVLSFDFADLKKDHRLLRVFGNLPYNISTPLIFHVLSFASIISDMLFMLQKEVALRLAAVPGSSDYGRLSVMVQYHCQVDLLFDVSKDAFYPPPKVESSIVRLLPYTDLPYHAYDYSSLERVVKEAFTQRRKTLRNSLRNLVTDAMWEQLKIRSDLRAENISVHDFVRIANLCYELKNTSD